MDNPRQDGIRDVIAEIDYRSAAAAEQPRGLPQGAFRLDGKRALVSGASKNIGLEIAAAFAQSGADVMIVAREGGRLEEAARRLRCLAPGRTIETCAADISDPGGAEKVADRVEEVFGGVDILVNNAHLVGDTRGRHILDITDETWLAVLSTNLLGPIRLMRRLIKPIIDEGRSGSVINILSGAGFQATPGVGAYGTSKAALWMLTRYLSAQCAPHVRVNAICPGIVTETGRPRFSFGEKLLREGGIPLGRIGLPEEVAGAAVYLASPAASYTTGEVIFCNGGRPW